MKPMCEANCGNRTQVSGCKYCPECYQKYELARSYLNWCPALETPRYESDSDQEYLILNPCDGYHIVYTDFDHETKKFERFTDFMRTQTYDETFFIAWAKLPDGLKLSEIFKS